MKINIEITTEEFKELMEQISKSTKKEEPNKISDYARWFNEKCLGWTMNPDYNLTFLKCNEKYFNEQLKTKGYVMLVDVYKHLGIPVYEDDHYFKNIGWRFDRNNIVDFGIYTPEIPDRNEILLNFNVNEESKVFDI